MSIRIAQKRALGAISAFLLLMAPTANTSPPEQFPSSIRYLRTLDFNLGDTLFSLPVPSRQQSRDTIVAAPLRGLDPSSLERAQSTPTALFSGVWDWDRGPFSDGPRSLGITLSLRSYPEGASVHCLGRFEEFTTRLVAEMNAAQMQSDPPFRSMFLIESTRNRIDGRIAARVLKRGFENGMFDIIPISDSRYLRLEFRFFPVERTGTHSKSARRDVVWRERMESMARDIRAGIKVSGSPPLEDCDREETSARSDESDTPRFAGECPPCRKSPKPAL